MGGGRLEFRLFGSVEAFADGRRIELGRRQERCLLGLLLMEINRPVSDDRLLSLIWESPAPTAVGTLRTYVTRLRSRLRPVGVELRRSNAGYLVNADPLSVDLHRFKAEVARAMEVTDPADRAELLRAALALWRGPLLAGAASDSLRDRIAPVEEEGRRRAVEWCAQAELACGHQDAALIDLRRLVDEDPLRERGVALLMLALYRAGRQAEALALFRHTRDRFTEELGIEPRAELQRLHVQVLDNDPALDPPALVDAVSVPRQLPRRIPDFIGRAAEFEQLDAIAERRVADRSATVCVIIGPGGVGKTAFAVHWAHRRAGQFPDGQLYVNLRGFDLAEPLRPINALTRLLTTLGVPLKEIPTDEDSAAALYRSLLARQRVLLVLDNARTAAQVRPLLPGGDASAVLVTSRDALHGLIARDGARPLRLERLSAGEAGELLVAVVGAERIRQEPRAAARLTELCGYLPLALRIVAARLAVSPAATLSDLVRAIDGGNRLDELQVPGDPDTVLRTVLDQSYAALTTGDQQLFPMLALIPGPDFTAAAVAALAGIGLDQAHEAIERLADVHLVGNSSPGRYLLHDLLRIYAREKARAEVPGLRRLMAFYLGHIDAAARLLYPTLLRLESPHATFAEFPDEVAAAAWLDAELPCLMDALRHSGHEVWGHETTWLLADGLRGYFSLRSNRIDWLAAANAGLRAAIAAKNTRARAAAHLSLGMAARAMSEHTRAAVHYRAASSLARSADWPEAEASAQTNLGGLFATLGQVEQAAWHCRRALSLHRRLGDATGTTSDLVNLGMIQTRMGLLSQAIGDLTDAVEKSRRLSHADLLAAALHNLGYTSYLAGEHELALRHLDEARDVYARLGHLSRVSWVDATSALVHHGLGRMELALPLAQRARTVLHDLGRHLEEAHALNALGLIERTLNRHSDAEDHLTTALALARQCGAGDAEAAALVNLAELHHQTRRPRSAADLATSAIACARRDGHRIFEDTAVKLLAELQW